MKNNLKHNLKQNIIPHLHPLSLPRKFLHLLLFQGNLLHQQSKLLHNMRSPKMNNMKMMISHKTTIKLCLLLEVANNLKVGILHLLKKQCLHLHQEPQKHKLSKALPKNKHISQNQAKLPQEVEPLLPLHQMLEEAHLLLQVVDDSYEKCHL